ncbi:DgyrCDS1388 [Dimorphilus gyrociliatus]|uniref:DgyrCDS1388 n=1 Tax=Dimorphilus gyrociliatus TaxID=2664684 RepID=A0A7I8V7D4_9ANNE|nr:DgyrCDS1388 [Dimorphilus gyrociliatus]
MAAVCNFYRRKESFHVNEDDSEKFQSMKKPFDSLLRRSGLFLSICKEDKSVNSQMLPPENIDSTPEGACQFDLSSHKIIEHNYPSVNRCCVCAEFIWGFLCHGYTCRDCNLHCHIECANNGVKECSNSSTGNVSTTKSSFLYGLSSQSESFLKLLIENLERRAEEDKTEVAHLYEDSNLDDNLMEVLNSKGGNVCLDSIAPSSISSAILQYLRELPDPPIPVSFYKEFIKVSNSEQLFKLYETLPMQQKSTMDCLLSHISKSRIPVRFFSTLFLRPGWNNILDIEKNLTKHETILNRLAKVDNKCITETPPRRVSCRNLEEQYWYWPNLSRDKAAKLLVSQPDGSFLVRDSSNKPGDYTLTLKCDGKCRLVKIYQKNGKFGFCHPNYEFKSVFDLVESFKFSSLAAYNPELNIKLLYPIERGCEDLENMNEKEILEAFLKVHDEISIDERRVLLNWEKSVDLENDLSLKKTALEDFKELSKIFESQERKLKRFSQLHEPFSTNDETRFKKCVDILQQRISDLDTLKTNFEVEIESIKNEVNELQEEVENLQGKINKNLALKRNYSSWLVQNMRLVKNQIDYLISNYESLKIRDPPLKQNSIKEAIKNFYRHIFMESDNRPDHVETSWQEKDWLTSEMSRTQAIDHLKNKKPGTFLIRRREDEKKINHALSIVATVEGSERETFIAHCIIENQTDGIGFSYPFNFSNLHELVEYYRYHSLKYNNKSLDVKLEYPAFL